VEADSWQRMLAWASEDATHDDPAVKQALKQWVPEYVPDLKQHPA